MKYALLVFAFAGMFSACSNADNPNTDSSRDARIDSIVGAKKEEINQRAMDDLEKRMATEVKGKADSIVKARMAGDTARH